MVCSNCKSTDIVSIQGLNYCINCGQRVAPVAPAPAVVKASTAALSAVTVKATKTTPKAKPKAAVAKPASVTQEAPQIKIRTKPKQPAEVEKSSLIINHPTVSTPKITVKTKVREEAVAAVPARASSKAAPLDLRTDERRKVLEARQAMLSKSAAKPTRLSDVRPKKITPVLAKPDVPVPAQPAEEALAESTRKVEAAVTKQPQAAESAVRSEHTSPASDGSALVFAWKQLGNIRFLSLALIPALLPAIASVLWRLNVDTVQFYQLLAENPEKLIGTELLTNSTRYGSGWLAAVVAIYLAHLTIAAAITYASSKTNSSKPSTWLKVAFNSLGGIIRIDLLLLPLWLALLGIEYLLVANVAYSSMATWQQLAILIPSHIAVMYLALGLVFVRLLGGYAVVLGEISAREAIRVGWNLYRKRTLALAVSGVIGGLLSGLIYLPALALNYANRDLPAEISGVGQILGAAVFTAILSALTLVFVTTYFYKHYRRSVLTTMGTKHDSLLSARKPKAVHRGTKLWLWICIITILGVATLIYMYPQLMTPVAEEVIRAIVPN